MFTLKPLCVKLTLSRIPVDSEFYDVQFFGYDIKNYKFEENLDFASKQSGTYIFTKRENTSTIGKGHNNQILYIGETEDLRTRFCDHDHKEDLIKHGSNAIFVCKTNSKEEAVKLQNKLLGLYPTPINSQLSPKDKSIIEIDYSIVPKLPQEKCE